MTLQGLTVKLPQSQEETLDGVGTTEDYGAI